ncbi:ABC transporter ATPase [Mucilaginibacter achroorhodeus]|uniref:ABC transporter ATPase n=1 Tax=Mucilaginibacter achroorhodeus TaxID=2599294 RepID=A0A563U8X9_9SPHI|nr:ABC transporter ATPase [Mucilaginibacter achroorhodeus]TWR27842.1 ABC transporter ATPase [Mucilaginibacter achroorhodeus]
MEFSSHSRVWIYQSDRELTALEAQEAQVLLDNFTRSWTAHNNKLLAKAEIRYNRFLILFVDESQAGASGCSIDKSVHFIKQLEQHFGINLFDRFNLAYRDGDVIRSVPRQQFENLIKEAKIKDDTIVFNNLVQTLADLRTKWEVPFNESWHVQLFGSLS